MRELAHMLFDPRGRVNRKGLLILAVSLLVVQVALFAGVVALGLSLDNPVVITLKVAFVWIAIAAASKRLHDRGLSASWIVGALCLVIAWSVVACGVAIALFGIDAMKPGTLVHAVTSFSVMVPIVLATLWLHFAPGEPAANRHGPVPSGHGFSRKARTDGAVDDVEVATIAS